MVRGESRSAARWSRHRRPTKVGTNDQASATDLVRRCLEHDPDAWEEFVHRYGRLIFATIHRKVRLNDSEAEDAFQNTILAIHTGLPNLGDPEKIVSWIVQIAYRQGVNRIRKRQRSRETALEDLPEAVLQKKQLGGDHEPSVPEEMRRQLEYAQQAKELLDAVSERCRRLLKALFYEDPPPDYKEIATRYGIPVGSIGPTRARCLEKMRKVFLERGWKP